MGERLTDTMVDRRKKKLRLPWRRLGVAALGACGFILSVYPWEEGFAPEGNVLAGPLWLVKSDAAGEKIQGAVAVALLIPLIFSFAFRPRILTAVLSGAGILIWIYIGNYLAAIASA